MLKFIAAMHSSICVAEWAEYRLLIVVGQCAVVSGLLQLLMR